MVRIMFLYIFLALHCGFFALISEAFFPVFHGEAPRGKKCEDIFYPNFAHGVLDIFDGDLKTPPFDGNGKISLGGGIETAIDPNFCRRMTSTVETDPKYTQKCAQIIDSIISAANIWADRHPSLYFNWTNPKTDIEKAELVISSDFDTFRSKAFGNVLAYQTHIGEKEMKMIKPLGGGSSRINAHVSRKKIMVNPYICWYYEPLHIRGCKISAAIVLACIASIFFFSCLTAMLTMNRSWKEPVYKDNWIIVEDKGDSESDEDANIDGGVDHIDDAVKPMRFKTKNQIRLVGYTYPRMRYAILTCIGLLGLIVIGVLYKTLDVCPEFLSYEILDFGVLREEKVDRTKKCYDFVHVLAHEIGHVLGVGHPNQGLSLKAISSTNPEDYVHVNASMPCHDLRIYKNKEICEIISSRSQCIKQSYCAWKQGLCVHETHKSLMYSMKGAEKQGDEIRRFEASTDAPLSEDDLASLFFLYPSRNRKRNWGTDKLRLREYSVAKLRSLSEDFHGGVCATLVSKIEILECIQEKIVNKAIKNLMLMEDSVCKGSKSSSTECENVINLRKAANDGLKYVRNIRVYPDSDSDKADNLKKGIERQQRSAEDTTYDVPNQVEQKQTSFSAILTLFSFAMLCCTLCSFEYLKTAYSL